MVAGNGADAAPSGLGLDALSPWGPGLSVRRGLLVCSTRSRPRCLARFSVMEERRGAVAGVTFDGVRTGPGHWGLGRGRFRGARQQGRGGGGPCACRAPRHRPRRAHVPLTPGDRAPAACRRASVATDGAERGRGGPRPRACGLGPWTDQQIGEHNCSRRPSRDALFRGQGGTAPLER